MCNICRYGIQVMKNYCSSIYNYYSIKYCNNSRLFRYVSKDYDININHRNNLEIFYLCNKIHTLQKMEEVMGYFNEILFIDKKTNSQVIISRINNTISINGIVKRIILGDVSLDYIFGY